MKKNILLTLGFLGLFMNISGCMSQSGATTKANSSNTQKYPAGMVINGYVLPPEPDSKTNNATLLGVDSNHNGIRDDVERFIIISESKNKHYSKIWTAIVLEAMKNLNAYMIDPTPTNKTKIHNTQECYFYVLSQMRPKDLKGWQITKWDKKHGSVYYNYHQGYKYWNLIFNTPERKKIANQLENTSLKPLLVKKNINACRQEIIDVVKNLKESR